MMKGRNCNKELQSKAWMSPSTEDKALSEAAQFMGEVLL